MEDLYKDDPNSWLRRTCFSKTVYHQPDPSQIPIIPLTKLKLGSSNPNSNRESISIPVTRDNTSKTTQTTTVSSLKSNNPDTGLTGKVQVESDSKTKNNNLAFIHGAISEMFKEVKNTIRSRLLDPPHGKRMVKSSGSQKKKTHWMKKYFDREVCQVAENHVGPPESGIED